MHHRRTIRSILARSALALIVLLGAALALAGPADDLSKADKLFKDKNYAEAAEAYRAFVEKNPASKDVDHADQRIVLCHLRMQNFDAAFERAGDIVRRRKGTPAEASAERRLGNLFLEVPNHGTLAGGKFLRGQWSQGRHVSSARLDQKQAVAHLERARDLFAHFTGPDAASASPAGEAAKIAEERIEALFDLAGALLRFGPWDPETYWPMDFWGLDPEAEAESTGEDPYDDQAATWHSGRPPRGLPIDAKGNPIFDDVPAAWDSKGLTHGRKALYVFAEIERIDTTPDRRHAARSVYRRGLATAWRFALRRWPNAGSGGPDEKIWTFGDDEVMTLVGGVMKRTILPPHLSPARHFRRAATEFRGDTADEALLALGVWYQTRQQFPAAIAAYDELLARSTAKDRAEKARQNREGILRPWLSLGSTTVFPAGSEPSLDISYRNAAKATFTATPLDVEDLIEWLKREHLLQGSDHQWLLSNLSQALSDRAVWRRFVGEGGTPFTVDLPPVEGLRTGVTKVRVPISERGVWVIEGAVEGLHEVSRPHVALVITDLAVVEKKLDEAESLYFVCDAATGAPVPGAKVDFFESWSVEARRRPKKEATTYTRAADADGLVRAEHREGRQVHYIARAGEGRIAFSDMRWASHHRAGDSGEGEVFAYLITDRPVYRPKDTVRLKVWLRHRSKGELHPAEAGRRVAVHVVDSRGSKAYEGSLVTDDFGGFLFELPLAEEAPLGTWHCHLDTGDGMRSIGAFAVEEYKKPEFEVMVKPDARRLRLGGTSAARIEARYYFGSPVTDGRVRWRVFREDWRFAYVEPGPWDWLYGPGYGRDAADYSWFPWMAHSPCFWFYRPAPPSRELVLEGEGRLDAEGVLTVPIETGKALAEHPDLDHRYTIEAEVTDASRRTIEGRGVLLAARQQFYAALEADRGWYRSGDQARIRIRALTADRDPVEAEGEVVLSRIAWAGEHGESAEETPYERFPARTDRDGLFEFTTKVDRSGQLLVTFTTKDADGVEVAGRTVVWVVGSDFEGGFHRFADLEILTDRRTYAEGDTARVLVNASRAGATVLFADDAQNGVWKSFRVLRLTGRSTTIELPVTRAMRPNRFIEAFTVGDGHVFDQVAQILVPPAEHVLDVGIAVAPEGRPGDPAEAVATVNDSKGRPAEAEIVLSVYDRSLAYIARDGTPPIAAFFHGRRHQHHAWHGNTLARTLYGRSKGQLPEDHFQTPAEWQSGGMPRSRKFRDSNSWGDGGFLGGIADAAAPTGGAIARSELKAAAPAPAERDLKAGEGGRADAPEMSQSGRPGQADDLKEARVRSTFADTAFFAGGLRADSDGRATSSWRHPDNLTTWTVRAHAMTRDGRVGQASVETLVRKKLIVRLQAPRFFVERDEVVLSANIHNALPGTRTVRASLVLPEAEGILTTTDVLTRDVEVASGGEARVDWRVSVRREGLARILVKGLTDEESDAVAMTFPVHVYGAHKTLASTLSMGVSESGDRSFVIDIPEQHKAGTARLALNWSPSLVLLLLDSLPFLTEYPYGCAEQTLSRFVPSVLLRGILQKLGAPLESLKEKVAAADPERLRKLYGERAASPVFDTAELSRRIREGLRHLSDFQHSDGGFGWWEHDRSSAYMTAYALKALLEARDNDVDVPPDMITRAFAFLARDLDLDWSDPKRSVHDATAFYAWVLTLDGKSVNRKLMERLHADRDHLGLQARAFLALAHLAAGDRARAELVLRNVMQYAKEDAGNGTCFFETPARGWWFWWNNDVETHAAILKALVAISPGDPRCAGIVRWLLNNRKNGTSWRSTRDTARVIDAMVDYARMTGEDRPDCTLTVSLDGAVLKTVRIDGTNLLSFDGALALGADRLPPGRHVVTIAKTGRGALHASAFLSYFTQEDEIRGAGHEVFVDRKYFRLEQITDATREAEGSRGEITREGRLRWRRIPIAPGDVLPSGTLVEVELRITSKNDYDFLVFEDMKPAGCEPVELRSGSRWGGGVWNHMELRDEKVAFFVTWLDQGEHVLRYRLRAEIPGVFNALPAKVEAMYAPEIRGLSDGARIAIRD